jgi:DNA-binding MurR/RpiR family transcriptional regulator
MKLTTKLLKRMIKEEMEEAYKRSPEAQARMNSLVKKARKSVKRDRHNSRPMTDSDITNPELEEGLENLTPENLQMAVDMLIKMSQEFAPVIAGSGLLAAAMKAKEMLAGGEEVLDDPQYYDDEIEEGVFSTMKDIVMGPEDTPEEKKKMDALNQKRRTKARMGRPLQRPGTTPYEEE